MLKRKTALPLVAVSIAFIVSSCGSGFSYNNQDAPRDSKGAVTQEETVAAAKIKVGDCTIEPNYQDDNGSFSDIKIVPCDQPHSNEVYFDFQSTQAAYPGDDGLFAEAEEQCGQQFKIFTGIDYHEQHSINYNYIIPTAESWKMQDDRLITCIVFADDRQQTTGSFAGKGVAEQPVAEDQAAPVSYQG